MRISFPALIAIGLGWLCLTVRDTDAVVIAEGKARVDEQTLAGVVANARIQAYDLSPDGRRVALFVVSGDHIQAPSFIVMVSAADSQILKQVHLGTSRQYVQGYAPQVAFAANGRLLVVQDGQTVNVFDAATLAAVRTIAPDTGSRFDVPAAIATSVKSATVAISFGTGAAVINYMDKQPVHIAMVDVSTGKQVGAWDADDVPFSISPNAEYVALSDHSTSSRVMGVAILDTRTGSRLITLTGGFPNRAGGYPDWKGTSKDQFWTRIIAKFISDDELVMTPDGNKDQSGSDIGASLKVVRFKDTQVTQEITPENYGPTGEIAVSANQNTFVAISRYIAPKYLTHHLRVPPDSKPELLVFRRRQILELETRTHLRPLLTLRMRGPFEIADLRISADGSVISVAEDYGVTILTRK
jgi:hypothetical protein